MSFKVDFNVEAILDRRKLGKNIVRSRRFIANEFARVTDPFVPFRDGYLKNSASIAIDGSFVLYSMPYARRLYYGKGFNFNEAPTRGAEWGSRSWAVNGDEVIKAYARYIGGTT